MVTLLPCVSLSQVVARLGMAPYARTLTSLIVIWLIKWSAAVVTFLRSVWYVRSTVRRRFHITGSGCWDCCASFCCSCCVIAQMATHTKSYQPGACDFGPVDTLPPFEGPQQSAPRDNYDVC
ncbi:TPA: hypothetical protein N0F65_008801 [Lagenidium giganteum]|uniref:Uncharacterized protein n=1 Tax=Lagenidium giganteum TaxID=4803 RepID=A0AAV2YUV3_9STRA|nr:TPA: hypothetical protein N0F65_008801 [Lagenidium giganteum]